MRKSILPIIAVLVAALVLLAIPTEAEGAIYEDTVRLHILANSDTEEDQALKLAVRDAVLREFSAELRGSGSKEAAEKKINTLLPEIEALAEKVVKENGYTYSVSVSVGEEWYSTRKYEDFTLPAGKYTSLVIEIGEGDGRNWWCVMYPPLCLGASVEDAAAVYSDEEVRLIRNEGVKVKFKALELISKYFG